MANQRINGTPIKRPSPFSRLEILIAYRYLRARRREGGVSTIAWYSFLGVMLGVATLIVVQAVMVGFKEEFTDRIIGANPHIILQPNKNIIGPDVSLSNQKVRETKDRLLNMGGIKHSYPVIKGQVMAARNGKYSGLQVIGIRKKDLANIELISDPEKKVGSIEKFANGVAIGIGVARDLNLSLGDEIRLVAPDGINTLFGITTRVSDFEVVYIFGVGR